MPRAEPPDGYAGGKVDFLEAVPPDLAPLLRGRRDIVLEVINRAGSIGNIRPNAAHPPFSNARARQALLLIVDQAEFAGALAGSPKLGHACYTVFVCGTPYATEAGAAPWMRPDFAKARALLAEAGYRGEPVVLLDPADQPDIHMIAQLTADALRRAGPGRGERRSANHWFGAR